MINRSTIVYAYSQFVLYMFFISLLHFQISSWMSETVNVLITSNSFIDKKKQNRLAFTGLCMCYDVIFLPINAQCPKKIGAGRGVALQK